MGNRFSRRRDAPASTTETVATQQKSSVEPATRPTEPAEDSGMKQTQEVVYTEKLEALVEEPVTSAGCSLKDESTLDCTEVETPAVPVPVDEPEPEEKETPAQIQPEPLVSASKDPEPEPTAPPKPVAEGQITPEPVSEPVHEAEPASCSKEVTEMSPDIFSESEPPLGQHLGLPSQDSPPEPVLSIPLLINFGVPDVTLSPAPIHALLSPDEPSNISGGEQCKGSVEAAEGSTLEQEESTETSEFLEKQIEVEAGECLETLGSDVNGESLSEILKNSELKGNDLHSDFIPSDVNISDDTPIIDMSTSIEMM